MIRAAEKGTSVERDDLQSDKQAEKDIVVKTYALAACFTLLSTAVMGQSLSPGSVWTNTRGSIFTITDINAEGYLTGTYVNKAAGFGCQNEPMAVSGRVKGNLLSFTVRWENANVDCNSITSWTGYSESDQIFTDWDLVFIGSGTGKPTHMKDSSVFTKQ